MLYAFRGLVALVFLCAGIFNVSVFAAEAEGVAQVGSLTISNQEMNQAIQKVLPLNVSFHGGVSPEKIQEIKKKALDGLVQRALKVLYALSEELVVDNGEVDRRFQKIRDRFKSEADFRDAIGAEGAGFLRADIYRDLLAEKAEEAAVGSKVKVPETKIKEYYETNKARFKRPRQYHASHILIKVDPSSNQEERTVLLEKAEDLLEKAKAGDDFYNLAYYNSDDRTRYVGGDLGTFHEGQTVPEFDAALKSMKPGEISGPIKTMYGYHIIKLFEVKEPKQLSYEEMHDKIKSDLEKQQREQLTKDWMDALKEKYPVKYY
ncbi:peptidylprolyl isomerase [Desulfuromonas carbonis]|nr:PpiC-type peptidylprolyl cis-trans isomerase [Desulfuromonas sp. DDH964]